MKHYILYLLLGLSLAGCCNDDDQPENPLDQLPPATQTGANTAGCLVDGEVFLPNNKSMQPLICNYLDGKDFSIVISRKIDGITYKIYIYIGDTQLEVGQTYELREEIDGTSKFGWYYIQYPLPDLYTFNYKTKSTIIGELVITHHDFDKAILSGTFWFDAQFNSSEYYNGEVNENKIIKVREGRFDMEY
ncbi:hypothetical protein [Formosa sp. A9]|uniref:hypothetical protein n=1 Tax=Formosa sp. A9 TaxID=3442641 RepID=UPI003EBB3D3C